MSLNLPNLVRVDRVNVPASSAALSPFPSEIADTSRTRAMAAADPCGMAMTSAFVTEHAHVEEAMPCLSNPTRLS